MLSSLRIKNLALVEDLFWKIGPGLVCVTGETGAGKSMIVGALKLVLGERADRSLIRAGADTCTVEAVFTLPHPHVINPLLEEAGLEPCDGRELIIKRIVAASGQNKQFINNGHATLSTLRELGRHLVDLHGPHDHQSLLSQDRQRSLLDAFAGAESATATYQEAYRRWQQAQRELQNTLQAAQSSEAEIDLLRHQIAEIDAAQIQPDEESALLPRYQRAANAARLAELCAGALNLLSEDSPSLLSQIRQLQKMLRDLERLDSSQVEAWKGVATAMAELEEVEHALRDYSDQLEADPDTLHALEERINLLESLKRKYGGSLSAVLEHRERAAEKLSRVENRDQLLAELRAGVEAARQRLDQAATTLRTQRKKAAPKLAKEITSHLLELGFKQASFEIVLEPLPEPSPHGTETVDYFFAPNPGEPARPLRLIASSGEMSRLMLAIKSALAKQDAIPLLVFDEIDANIGGEIASRVGRKMAALGRFHQVISITHMPQVAALADSHYEVTKTTRSDRTFSSLRRIDGEARLTEIARMLGGTSASALAHAKTLLGLK